MGGKEDTVWLTELFSLKSLMPARKRQLNYINFYCISVIMKRFPRCLNFSVKL